MQCNNKYGHCIVFLQWQMETCVLKIHYGTVCTVYENPQTSTSLLWFYRIPDV